MLRLMKRLLSFGRGLSKLRKNLSGREEKIIETIVKREKTVICCCAKYACFLLPGVVELIQFLTKISPSNRDSRA